AAGGGRAGHRGRVGQPPRREGSRYMASFDTTRRLVGALDAARTFRRQSAGLLALLLACAACILSSADTPEPFAGLLLAVAACALVIELGLALAARRREAACADELILSGFGC